MRNAKKSPASAGRNGGKPAPERKPRVRPRRAKSTTAPCYSAQELTALDLALPAEWPVEHYSYGPCESDGGATMTTARVQGVRR